MDDDICILKHETAYVAESPVAMCSGDESVASHFALVTAYEDIKKRLQETEKENTLLRKRVKQLEDKVSSQTKYPQKSPENLPKDLKQISRISDHKSPTSLQTSKTNLQKTFRLLMSQMSEHGLNFLLGSKFHFTISSTDIPHSSI